MDNTINLILLIASIALLILGAVGGRVLGKISHRWVVGLWSLGISLLFFSLAGFALVSIENESWVQISIAIGIIFGFATYLLIRDMDLTIDDLEATRKMREPYLVQILPLLGDMQTYQDNLSKNIDLNTAIDLRQLDDMTNRVFNRVGGWEGVLDTSISGHTKYCLILGAGMQAIGAPALDNQSEWIDKKNRLQQIRIYIPDKKLNQLIKWHLILLEGTYYNYIYGRYVYTYNIDSFDLDKKIAAIVADCGRSELLNESSVKIARRIEELRAGRKLL